MPTQHLPAIILLSAIFVMLGCSQNNTELRAVSSPPTDGKEALYVSNPISPPASSNGA